ncbi:alkaline phosphatase, tissue-nonspecific isozyme-like [Episyrphus balteatus]|uniref:alkaline phosphatase, tissue-nonspecific isozyme-like n=1 Tax=Episyrphus balteatus TaxID=286459 RepID=UPI0024854B81|nr:alkaline phosphatase, tissue-nonspecific isozyme-like [Episyrphus balteatus]
MKNKFLVIVLSLTIVAVHSMPKRCTESEDCYDEQLHPDLPSNGDSPVLDNEEDLNSYWLEKSKSFVQDQLARELNSKKAKNAIFFLGDGMGLTTLAAARVYMGGVEKQLSFEKFPYTGLSKTYCVDRMVPDSATTSTSYLCGVKTNTGTIGVNAQMKRSDCEDTKNSTKYVYSIGKWAMDAGKAAGFVTTTTVNHASPSGLYAHTAERSWESEMMVEMSCGKNSGVESIAEQLIHGDVGSRLKVMMGGGKMNFKRDGKTNLIDDYKGMSEKNGFVETRSELMSLDLNSVDRLLGVFSDVHMDYNLDKIDKNLDQPSLEEMTRRAIELMQKEKNGYFLFIEGGRIDTAHHNNEAKLSLDETEQFSKAIQAAREITSEDDTLIIVSADHSHTFSYSGYMDRNQKITDEAGIAADGLPYMALNYVTGPGFKSHYDSNKRQRIDPTSTNGKEIHANWPTAVPQTGAAHGGEDVAVYASGPWAHLFTGVFEQNTIPHMLAYALCIGDGLKSCDK